MEAQTLQQQTPIYHVCQHCGGEGCAACSDLLILDGDIQLDPEWSDELPAVAPINGVIGIKLDGSLRDVLPDPVCPYCGKTDYDAACGCLSPNVYSTSVGDWSCAK